MHRVRLASFAIPLTLLPLLLAGCGGSSPDKTLTSVSSWTATVHLATADFRRRRVPTLYATELRDQARSALLDSRRTLGSQPLAVDDRRRATASLDSLHAALASLDHELDAP